MGDGEEEVVLVSRWKEMLDYSRIKNLWEVKWWYSGGRLLFLWKSFVFRGDMS